MDGAEVTGRVVAIVDADDVREAVVAIAASSACARCREGRGCGAWLPGSGTGETRLRVTVPSGLQLAEGDRVTVHMSGPALLTAAGIAYGLPLAGLLLGALLGHLFVPGDLPALFSALTGLMTGAWLARRRAAGSCWRTATAGLLHLEA